MAMIEAILAMDGLDPCHSRSLKLLVEFDSTKTQQTSN
jgi:hypothetical protein